MPMIMEEFKRYDYFLDLVFSGIRNPSELFGKKFVVKIKRYKKQSFFSPEHEETHFLFGVIHALHINTYDGNVSIVTDPVEIDGLRVEYIHSLSHPWDGSIGFKVVFKDGTSDFCSFELVD